MAARYPYDEAPEDAPGRDDESPDTERPGGVALPRHSETRAERQMPPEGVAVIDPSTGRTIAEEHDREHARAPSVAPGTSDWD